MACEESRPCIIQTSVFQPSVKMPAGRYSFEVKYMKCSNVAICNMRASVIKVFEVDNQVKPHR